MAGQRRSRENNRRYRTYGSAAYQPETERELSAPARRERVRGNAVRRPEPARRPRIVPRRRPAARPDVQVRTQTAVAPFAVAGIFAVLMCAFLLVLSIAQLAATNSEIVDLREDLADLQDEGQALQAKYELVFDLETIEKMFLSNGTMVRPRNGQTVYLDLSAPDNVVYYDGAGEGLSAIMERAEQFLSGLLS